MRILKFGGSSVANKQSLEKTIEIVVDAKSKYKNIAVVVSALGGITDDLIQLTQLVCKNKTEFDIVFNRIEGRHVNLVKEMIDISNQPSVLSSIKETLNQLEDVCKGIVLVNESTARTIDFVLSFGERLSASIISEILKQKLKNVDYLDARNLIKTDHSHGKAKVNFSVTNNLIRNYFLNNQSVNVITGFIASSDEGNTTTLGRSGSDYTASIFGAALNADAIEIWTDVDGVMSADPRKVKDAISLSHLTYEEAMELSHFGAKVIFPATMIPAMRKNIPIWIKNTFNKSAQGTLISSAKQQDERAIKGISSISNICLLNVKGDNMLGSIGVSQRLFECLAQSNVNIILISQASSEHSICLAVEREYAENGKKEIDKTFEYEISRNWIDPVEIISNLAIVAIVGENMRQTPGISGRLFSALGENGINVRAIAQGSSELNISTVIEEKDLSKALNAIHQSFFLSESKQLNLYLAGVGIVGSELLNLISSRQAQLMNNDKINVIVRAISNSKKMILNATDIDVEEMQNKMLASEVISDMQKIIESLKENNLPNSVFIDATSSEEVVKFYPELFAQNASVVTANKKANSGLFTNYKKLREVSQRNQVHYKYETNVGAGLPVISVLKDLINGGDEVEEIEAVLSGTINYLLTEFNENKLFSDLVIEAMKNGYSEPDPRDDLNGVDVARKILILARECGSAAELHDVDLKSFVPEKYFESKSREEFLAKLKSYDETFTHLFASAKSINERLRYVARYNGETLSVKLVPVKEDHPFYALKGTENCIIITSKFYKKYPLVIKGPGAGASVTASGILSEVFRIIKN